MRDTIQTKEYFDEMIAFDQMVIDENKDTINNIKLHEGRAGQVHDLRHIAVNLCCQHYSQGNEIKDMKSSVNQMAMMFKLLAETMPTLTELTKAEKEMWANLGLTKLFDYLWCLAFMVGLRYSKANLSSVLTWIGHTGEDGLLDRIAVLLGQNNRQVKEKSKFEPEFGSLVELMDAPPAKRPALLKTYVEGWYKRMKRASWHNTHKGEAYCGYWCFEGALLAMLLNIDDSAVQGHIHYPFDLVRHYRATA